MKGYLNILVLLLFGFSLLGQVGRNNFSDTLLRKEYLLDKLDQLQADQHSSETLQIRKELSEIYLSQGNVSLALKQLLEAKINLGQEATDAERIDVLSQVGQIYFDAKLYKDALIYFNDVSQLENSANPKTENSKGECYAALKQTDQAFECFNNLYEKSRRENRVKDQYRHLQQIVDLYYDAKNYEKALLYNTRLEKLINKTPQFNAQYIILNNLGYNYTFLQENQRALEQFEKSLTLIPEEHIDERNSVLINMAICQNNMGNMNAAIRYFSKALDLIDTKNDPYGVAQINHLMATTYYKNKDFYTAFDHLDQSIDIATANGYSSLLAESYYTAATIRVEENKFKEALNYFEDYLSIRDSLAFEEALNQQQMVQEEIVLERLEKELELVKIDKALKKTEIEKLNLENNNLKLAKKTLELNALKNKQQLELSKQESTIQKEKLKNQELEITKDRQRLLLATKEKNEARQQIELLRLSSDKEKQAIELLEKDKQINAERQTAKLLKQQGKIDQLEIESQKQFRKNSITIGLLATGLLGLLLAGVFYMLYSNKKLNVKNKKIIQQRKKIESEKEVSDRLLHNILPVQVADELKLNGKAIPKKYEKVTVLFTDFSGFTNISSSLSPEELIQDLEECFLAFDKIIEKYDIEKIKTIGDSYMCAGGIPKENDHNAMDCVLAAIEMQEYIEQLHQQKIYSGREYWRMRVGIHTGPVVAGVIGNKKFSYDIWGDTVNIASRLETHGALGKVNISQITYNCVKHKIKCTYRGEIDVKNRGPLGMYFTN